MWQQKRQSQNTQMLHYFFPHRFFGWAPFSTANVTGNLEVNSSTEEQVRYWCALDADSWGQIMCLMGAHCCRPPFWLKPIVTILIIINPEFLPHDEICREHVSLYVPKREKMRLNLAGRLPTAHDCIEWPGNPVLRVKVYHCPGGDDQVCHTSVYKYHRVVCEHQVFPGNGRKTWIKLSVPLFVYSLWRALWDRAL